MKKIITAGKLAPLAVLFALMLHPVHAGSESMITTPLVVLAKTEEVILTPAQTTWKAALRKCESGTDDTQINKQDRDGTWSYGRYQFKPSTFAYFAKRYDLPSTTDYMNGDAQDEIVSNMIVDKRITIHELRTYQFPDCIQHKIGNLPR